MLMLLLFLLVERVYEQRPHDMSTATQTTQTQGLALCSRCHPAWAPVALQRGRGKDTHGTLGPLQREAVGGPTPTTQT